MLRQTLVHEGVIRAQQVQHAAVLANHAVDEQLGLLTERLPQVVVEIEERPWIGHVSVQIPQM
jgi:hypothetical protein